jgi:mannose-6-phosphate isomerase-like protein (cupin superfamily)
MLLDLMPLTERVSPAPRIVRADEGLRMGMGPEKGRLILSSAATGDAFMLAEATIDVPHFGPPYHVHQHEDETFMVLEGTLVLIVDGVRHEVRAGDVAFAPRNVPHRFESGPEGVRFHIVVTGDNFERFIPRYAAAFEAGETHRLDGIAAEHGITFLPEA